MQVDTGDRFKTTKKVGTFGIIGNIFLLVIKGTAGIISRSQAMIADSINSAGDIFASLMTFIGNKIASTPIDDDHNFGHGKAEYIFSLFISISMIIASVKTAIDSITNLFRKSELTFSWWLVVVCITTIVVKIFLYIYTRIAYKKCNNILLQASMEDHRNDCVITTTTLISILLSLKGIYWVDCVVGIGIAMWIFKTGIEIFHESFNVLMDASIDEETKDMILNTVKAYKDVKTIRSISSTPVGYQYLIFLVIEVDGEMTTYNSHKLADEIEESISSLNKISKAIVHVEPYIEND